MNSFYHLNELALPEALKPILERLPRPVLLGNRDMPLSDNFVAERCALVAEVDVVWAME
jgi:hypothetical protein